MVLLFLLYIFIRNSYISLLNFYFVFLLFTQSRSTGIMQFSLFVALALVVAGTVSNAEPILDIGGILAGLNLGGLLSGLTDLITGLTDLVADLTSLQTLLTDLLATATGAVADLITTVLALVATLLASITGVLLPLLDTVVGTLSALPLPL